MNNETSYPNKILEMIDLFYANKHLYEKIAKVKRRKRDNER